MERVFYFEQKKCTGCDLCALICSYSKECEFNLHKSRIGLSDQKHHGFFQIMCRNCEDAPCLDACPAGAIYKRRTDGHVVLNEKQCVGCNMCVMVCPFNAISIGDNFNFKCDTCEGKELCTHVCYHGAIKFGDHRQYTRKKRRKMMDGIIEP